MLIKNVLLISIFFFWGNTFATEKEIFKGRLFVTLSTEKGKEIRTVLAISKKNKDQGLSGIKKNSFKKDQAMLFYYKKDGMRKFWMPNTYFNLDIFFLDSKLEVKYIERNVPHHPGFSEPPTIYRTKVYFSRHVLEMRSDSDLAKKIQPGHKLNLKKGFFP